MAKQNFNFEKRQRELKKAQKQEEKRLKKLAKNNPEPEVTDETSSDSEQTPPAES